MRRVRPAVRAATVLWLTVLPSVVLAAGCSASSSQEPDRAAATFPPLTAGPPVEGELSPGWDESPDGEPAVPDEELPPQRLLELLRTRASTAEGPDSCAPDEVTGRLAGFDAALGHRYTSLRVRNTSSRTCQVAGVPGLGARGEWGSAFTLTVEPLGSTTGHRGVVPLAPGEEAVATVEWTGELAGAESERGSMLVVQLASGQTPVRVPAVIEGDPEPLDLGMTTTLRVAPFGPAR